MKAKAIRGLIFLVSLGLAAPLAARLPEPTEEQKVAAAEKKAKDDASAEKAKAELAKAQDRVAARYIQEQKAKGITVTPTPIAAASPAAQTPAAADSKRQPEKAEAHSAPLDPKADAQKGDKVKNPAAKPN